MFLEIKTKRSFKGNTVKLPLKLATLRNQTHNITPINNSDFYTFSKVTLNWQKLQHLLQRTHLRYGKTTLTII